MVSLELFRLLLVITAWPTFPEEINPTIATLAFTGRLLLEYYGLAGY